MGARLIAVRCPHRLYLEDAPGAKSVVPACRKGPTRNQLLAVAIPRDCDDVSARRAEVCWSLRVDTQVSERLGHLAGSLGRQAQPSPGDICHLGKAFVI